MRWAAIFMFGVLWLAGCSPDDNGAADHSKPRYDSEGVHHPDPPAGKSAKQLKAEAETKERFRAEIKKRLLVPENGFDDSYLVMDEAFVNKALDRAMGDFGDYPDRADAWRLDRMYETARGAYRAALVSPPGLASVEKLVQERFDHPVIKETKRAPRTAQSVEDQKRFEKVGGFLEKVTGLAPPPRRDTPEGGIGRVEVDYGWVPGKLTPTVRHGVEQSGDNFDGHRPKSRLLARLFLDLLRRYPDASDIVLRMKIKNAPGGDDLRCSYHREFATTGITGRVVFDVPGLPSKYPIAETVIQGDDFSEFAEGKRGFFDPPPVDPRWAPKNKS